MTRYLVSAIKEDLPHKIILLSGPRQSGKTTLARSLLNDHVYLSWDNIDDRPLILGRNWNRRASLVVLDELHKMPKWKGWLKGIWDASEPKQQTIVTGSARLDTFRKVGDSLAGRFFPFRLHPLDLKELASFEPERPADEQLRVMLKTGGFPEPYLRGTERFYNRWKVSHLDIMLRQDLVDLETVHEVSKIETLVALLASRVGSPISYDSLAGDLQASDGAVRRWVGLLEKLFVVFRVPPYSRKISRSLLKAQKIYFYDTGRVTAGPGARFENLVACALLKDIEKRQDCEGEELSLNYLRDRDGNEIDFLVNKQQHPHLAIEVKLSDTTPAAGFKKFCPQLEIKQAFQLVLTPDRERSFPFGLEVVNAAEWLRKVEL